MPSAADFPSPESANVSCVGWVFNVVVGVIVDVFDANDAAFNARMTRATMNIVREYNADLSLTDGRKRCDIDNRRGWGG